MRANLPLRIFRISILVVAGLFFLLPLLAMARFAFQNIPTFNLEWSNVSSKWSLAPLTASFDDPDFLPALGLSLRLAVGTALLTVALLLPTAILVHLRLPRMRPIVEFLTVLPYVVPAIALVAGIIVIKPHARWFLNSDLSLIPFYMVLSLPFTYRSLDAGLRAIDLKILVEASRSTGANWSTTILRVLVPNLRAALLSSSFLSFAVVMGEYTLADILLKRTFPNFMAEYRQSDPRGGYGLAIVSIAVTVVLFFVSGRSSRRKS